MYLILVMRIVEAAVLVVLDLAVAELEPLEIDAVTALRAERLASAQG